METKINIADILKDKPVGLKFYSNTFGYINFNGVHKDKVYFFSEDTNAHSVKPNGKMYDGGECIIFPSKEMRDWEKFSWKKGDILVSEDNAHIIFEKFEDDTYTRFKGKHYLWKECDEEYYNKEETKMLTSVCEKATDDDAQTYISTIEERLGGKLNRETLEIEKTQPEFKDGDVLFVRCDKYSYIEIFNYFKKNGDLYDHTSLNITTQGLDISGALKIQKEDVVEIRLATDSEKQQLFSALAKDGKAWNDKRKAIVDLKPKVELKTFDKVLVKDNPYGSWEPALFWKKVDAIDLHPYMVIGGKRYRFCEPYEGNEHFLND